MSRTEMLNECLNMYIFIISKSSHTICFQFSIVECVMSAFTDEFPHYLRGKWESVCFRSIIVLVSFLLGLPMVAKVTISFHFMLILKLFTIYIYIWIFTLPKIFVCIASATNEYRHNELNILLVFAFRVASICSPWLTTVLVDSRFFLLVSLKSWLSVGYTVSVLTINLYSQLILSSRFYFK